MKINTWRIFGVIGLVFMFVTIVTFAAGAARGTEPQEELTTEEPAPTQPVEPSPEPSIEPTPEPTVGPTPTPEPTIEPTQAPIADQTPEPSVVPANPTPEPSQDSGSESSGQTDGGETFGGGSSGGDQSSPELDSTPRPWYVDPSRASSRPDGTLGNYAIISEGKTINVIVLDPSDAGCCGGGSWVDWFNSENGRNVYGDGAVLVKVGEEDWTQPGHETVLGDPPTTQE